MRFTLAILALTLASCGPAPEPPPSAVPTAAPPAPPSLEERMRSLGEKEKAMSVSFRTLHEAWERLLPEAKGTRHEATVREKLDSLEGRANLTYREFYRPVQMDVRRLVFERRPTEARDRLLAWTVPPEMDLRGVRSAERARELESLEELIRLEAARWALEKAYAAGDFSRDPALDLNLFRRSERVDVRTEADRALQELGQLRAVDLRRRRFLKAPPGVRPAFGERPGAPVPTEQRFASRIPAAAQSCLDEGRKILAHLERTEDSSNFRSLAYGGMSTAERAVDAAKWLPIAHYYLAEWKYLARGDTLGAILSLDEAIQRHPQFVEARLARARLCVEADLREQAGRELLLLRRALPDSLRTFLAAARRAFADRDPEEATAALDRAFRALPDDPSFLDRVPRTAEAEEPEWAARAIELETASYAFKAEPSKREGFESRLKRLADAAEAAHAWFPSILKVEGKPERKARVFLFASEESYSEFADPEGEEALAGSAGKFHPDGRRIMLYDMPDEAETRHTMLHEAWHEYFGRAPGILPTWLNEGLAEYAGSAEIKEGRVTGVVLSRNRIWTLDAAFRERWEGVPFEEIMGEGQREFYGTLRSLQYMQAWSMVHFFRHGEGGRHAPLFQSYLELVAGGTGRAEAFEETFGKEDLARIQDAWRAYVRSLPR